MDETNRVELDRVEDFKGRVQNIVASFGGMTFGEWLSFMRELQEVAYGAHYDDFDPETRAHSMLMNLYALEDEIHEMGNEMGWKPWASPQGWINREAVISEAVDAMHFLANLLSHAKCTGAELTEAYKAKMLKNLQRQIDGYDAVSDKCGQCKRDLTDGTTSDKNQIYETVHEGKIIKFCNRSHFTRWAIEHAKEILRG